MVPAIERGTSMYRSSDGPSLLQSFAPVTIVLTAASNDNGDMLLRDASFKQLTDAIRRKVEAIPVDQRERTAELTVVLMAYKLLGRGLSYAKVRS